MQTRARQRLTGLFMVGSLLGAPRVARADEPKTPLEPVVRRAVAKGQTCAELSRDVYGSAEHIALLSRYQKVTCPLPTWGAVLVLPAKAGGFPLAALRGAVGSVELGPAAAEFAPGSAGALLEKGTRVRVGAAARAELELYGGARASLEGEALGRVESADGGGVLELESGEARFVGAAGRVVVLVPGGGRVVATSSDFVVERRGERTTVVVYAGSARVESGKKGVELSRGQSTRWSGKAPPEAPRPLAVAPALADDPALVLTPAAPALRWSAEGAKGFRVEVARADGFAEAVTSVDLPAGERTHRLDGLAPGRYVARVVARDADDRLGARSAARAVLVASVVEGKVRDGALVAHPYGRLALEPLDVLEVSVDGSSYFVLSGPLDGGKLRAAASAKPALWLRAAGVAAVRFPLVFAEVEADLSLRRTPDGLDVKVSFPDLPEGAWDRLKPKLQGLVEDGPPVALGDVPIDGVVRVERRDVETLVLVDGEGRELARRPVPRPPPVPQAPRPEPPKHFGISALTADVPTDSPGPWLPPLARGAGLVGVMVSSRESGAVTVAIQTFGAYPVYGPLTLDAAAQSPGLDAPGAEAFGAPGVRVRAYDGKDFQLGAGARVYIPLIENGPPVRIEPTFSLAGSAGRVGLMGNLGVRFRVGDVSLGAPVPDVNAFATFGFWYDLTKWLRAYGVGDFAVLLDGEGFERVRGGARGGLEAGTDIFVSASGYVGSGISQAHGSGLLAFGFRRP